MLRNKVSWDPPSGNERIRGSLCFEARSAPAIPRPSITPRILGALDRDEATLGALDLDSSWAPYSAPDRVRVCTDDYASIVPLVRWW